MGSLDASDQEILKNAFKDALTGYGVAKSGDILPPVNDSPGATISPSGGMPGQSASGQTRFLETAISIPKKIAEAYNEGIEAFSADASGVVDQMNDIHAMYGNIKIERNDSLGAAADVLDRLNKVKEMYLDKDVSKEMAGNVGIASNYMTMHFKNETAAFEASERILGELVTEHASYIGQISDATLYKLPAYTQALGVSTGDIASIIEKSISLTGDANTTMMDDIAKFSEGLADATGVPLKSISRGAVQIVNDIKLMGDVSAEEATRMSATFAQLGMQYDEATSVFGKFQEFGSSADAAGMISQLTGGVVNLDAVELMELASEKPEEFLDELRNSMLSAGFDVDAYLQKGRTEQLLIAESVGMKDQAAFARFLRGTEDYNQEALKEVQKETAASDKSGYQSVIDNLDLAAGAFEALDGITAHHRAVSMLPLEQDLLRLAEARSKSNNMLKNNIELTDKAVTQAGNAALYQGLTKADEVLAKSLDREIKIGITDFGEIFDNQNKEVERINKEAIQARKDAEAASNSTGANVQSNIVAMPKNEATGVVSFNQALNTATQSLRSSEELLISNTLPNESNTVAIPQNQTAPQLASLTNQVDANNTIQTQNNEVQKGMFTDLLTQMNAASTSNKNQTFKANAPIDVSLYLDGKVLAGIITSRTFGMKYGLPSLLTSDE